MDKVSAYYLNCGHIQIKRIGAERVELYKEHGSYHVRRFCQFVDREKWIQENWLVFRNLKNARVCFKRLCQISKAAQQDS